MFSPKLCQKTKRGRGGCNKPMKPLIPTSRPASSEWYCSDCHSSAIMTAEEVKATRAALGK